MRKLHLYKNSTNFKEYTIRLIELLLGDALVADPLDAEYTLVSICDITEVGDIDKARALGRPVITGGLIADYPVVNELSDYTWHGEIYGFAAAWCDGVALADMPSITTRHSRRLVIDERIDWAANPIVRVGNRAQYYYTGKGCPVRCKYCYIGHVRQYQRVPRGLYEAALRQAGKDIMPIAAYNPYGVPGGAHIGETLLREYIAGRVGRSARLIRSGVEFATPELSTALAKGVTIEHVTEALAIAKANKTKLILYYIAGLEPMDALLDHFSQYPIDYATTPVVNVVLTYIDPQPFTPLQDFGLHNKITDIDAKEIYRAVNGRNKRVRVMPLAGPEKSLTRTLYARCESRADYERVRALRRKSSEEMLASLSARMIGASGLTDAVRRDRRTSYAPDYWQEVARC